MIGLKVIWFFICINSCVILVELICKFDAKVALQIKSNFVHILINIRAKVHLD